MLNRHNHKYKCYFEYQNIMIQKLQGRELNRVSCVTGRNTNHYTTSDYIISLDFLYYVCYRLCFFIYTSLTLLLHHTTTLLPPHPLNMRIQQIRRYNKLHIKLNVNSTITVSIIYDVTLNFEPNIKIK